MELTRYGGGLPPRRVGEVKVLSTEGRSATALVTKSTSRILIGDQFHTKHEGGAAPTALAPSMNTARSASRDKSEKTTVQHAARETRYSLNDLMRQLRYESGEARIKPEGYQMLDHLVELLKASPADQLIRVEGHADSMEIGPSLKSLYPTNWDLSKARATGVLRYLVEKGGIDSARISSVGFGATKPVMSNATEDGRSKNRRVEIVLYSPDAPPAPPEPTMTPSEAAADGYRVSGLESERPEPASPAPEHTIAPTESSAAEAPAATPPVVTDTMTEESPSAVPAETPAQP